jgi:hypothetical protein
MSAETIEGPREVGLHRYAERATRRDDPEQHARTTRPFGAALDAGQERGEGRAVDLHPVLRGFERRELEAAGLEALGQYAPAGAVEPEGLGDPSSLVEEEVEVSIDGIVGSGNSAVFVPETLRSPGSS